MEEKWTDMTTDNFHRHPFQSKTSEDMFLKFGLWVSSGFLNTKKLMKAAECFYCIRVLRNSYEIRSSSLWNGFSKGSNLSALHTKAKQRSCLYLFFAFSCFIKLLKHEQICKSVLWKMFFVIFATAAFRHSHFALTSSVAILKSGKSCLAGISLASFDHQK